MTENDIKEKLAREEFSLRSLAEAEEKSKEIAEEIKAVLLPERWDRALVGYTIPEGTRLAVGVYDYGKAVCRPFLVDLDAEDALIDALRAIEGEAKPIIIHSEVHLFGVEV